jgi:hypothetical protein
VLFVEVMTDVGHATGGVLHKLSERATPSALVVLSCVI